MINWREWYSLTTSDDTLSTTDRPRKILAIGSCGDATQLTSVTSRIPLERSKLHFPLIFKVAITNLGKYINLFSPQQWAENILIYCLHNNEDQLFTFYTYTGQWMASQTYICPWYSEHAPSPPLLYFFISYVDAPCLSNIKMNMTGTIREPKQKVTWSSARQ